MKRSGLVLIIACALIAATKWRSTESKVAGPASAAVESDLVTRAPTAVPAARAKATALPEIKVTSLARGEDLARYRELATRVFLNDDDAAARTLMIHDADLLVEAGHALVRRERSLELLERQSDALALLLDAARAGDAVAKRELLAVIHDATVEDVSLPRELRLNLAGLKAEAMYRWSAANAGVAGDIAAALPGPVSQKLWANAQARQRTNGIEGAAVGAGSQMAKTEAVEDTN